MIVSRGERTANYALLLLFAAFALAPVVTVVVTALGPAGPDGPGSVTTVGLENLVRAWDDGGFARYLRTSVLVAVVVVSVALVASLLAGYAFATMRFFARGVLFYAILVGIMVPTEAIVVPLFFDLRTFGLTDTLWAVALPQIAQTIAFGTFWMRTAFRASPPSLLEAATLDGAGPWRALWSVLVPVHRPATTTLAVLAFLWTWNEFLIPLVMSPSGAFRTAPLALALFKGQHTQATALLAAGALLVAIPVLALYVVAQRHVIAGMLAGSVRE
ncbi:binding-protein-dependent transport systems inner membrane component [Beutenbergia cavernae DSM 12333]|uniref:Binding-protein-dependent transport systems inner membrane component n=1 Tax=Beutenbergia cavernae (strain ATCC BAA-8 / DSM 12333 / CCUG 43141 / JCM 11478 / NBRC 16432 / NCIMB 13614 / HKI 0122) TaxID=471853 RepID=C5BXF4_BEUC1|nr:carbohydrate ABC transporter permease [Beutenbergia cavernae]ACQ80837.1 binding-protein-dependent transport systems inner membrane component [Beutenbergia cavernae DSM 12333]